MTDKILFKHQSSLPDLPVPQLKETLDLYLKSIQPLCTPEEYKVSLGNVKEFAKPGGMGSVLQERLLERAKSMNAVNRSWLIDWWNDYAYMGYRDPLVVFVSYFFGIDKS